MTATRPLGTILDVNRIDYPRVAGVESGAYDNPWMHCPFSIEPAATSVRGYQRGFRWAVTFNATDDVGETKRFSGVADTRSQAKHALTDAVTKHMKLVATTRIERAARKALTDQLSLAAGVPLATDAR